MLDTWTIGKTNGNGNNRGNLVSRRPNEKSIVWVKDVPIGGAEAVVIAGPCSVESREQVMATAFEVKQCGAVMLRGGAYKPRTSPYDFQGLGVEGLQLLAEAREVTGLPIITEIMDTKDLEVIELGKRGGG